MKTLVLHMLCEYVNVTSSYFFIFFNRKTPEPKPRRLGLSLFDVVILQSHLNPMIPLTGPQSLAVLCHRNSEAAEVLLASMWDSSRRRRLARWAALDHFLYQAVWGDVGKHRQSLQINGGVPLILSKQHHRSLGGDQAVRSQNLTANMVGLLHQSHSLKCEALQFASILTH